MNAATRPAPLALLVTTAIVLVAAAGASGAGGDGTLKVRLVDTTCYGPCTPQTGGSPYRGDAARVTVRRLPDGPRVAKRRPSDGRFRVALAPARYRVRARFPGDPCWEGQTARARVLSGKRTRVRLEVQNTCIRAR